MLSDEIRTRLAQLQRAPGFHESVRQADSRVAPIPFPERERAVATTNHQIENVLQRGEEITNSSGRHLRFVRPLAAQRSASDSMAPGGAGVPAARGKAAQELAAVATHFPHGTLFLDLETCGFAGSMIFLAGMVWQSGPSLIVDQRLARDYADEKSLLQSLWQIAARHAVLITFNGKSFDWPMVHDRSTRYHLGHDHRGSAQSSPLEPHDVVGRDDPRPELVHCDLLHHARRRWKSYLPNCKLQTLERHVCRRFRPDDLPGALVPAAYHQFVRTGEARHLGAILEHNACDLLTLVEITLALLPVRGQAVA